MPGPHGVWQTCSPGDRYATLLLSSVSLEASSDNLIGTVIDGRFEIRDRLGQGGMGTVYRAWQRSVGREVAIKLIDRSISNDPMSVRRFLREAHLASQLSHPNTISVLDFGHLPDGRLFTAMELLRGRTLGRELRAVGAFPLARIVRIGTQICDALEAAHAQRIVHRDLKLDNVMLLEHGNDLIKVLDFGLAKTLDDKSTQATAAGIVVGTPRYIAPETAMTGEATPASDMYALGVMLGELAIAGPLWEGTTLSVILQHQLQPEPVVATVPMPLRELVRRLVDPQPHGRPNAQDTRKLLALIGERKPLPALPQQRATVDIAKAPRASTTPSRKYALIAGGAIVFVGSVLGAYFATRKSDKSASAPNRMPVIVKPAQPAVVDASLADDPWTTSSDPALSPIVKAWTDNQPKVATYTVRMPRDYELYVDGALQLRNTFTRPIGERIQIEIWAPRHAYIFRSSHFESARDETLDFTIQRSEDCSAKDDRCYAAFCADHRYEIGCE